MKLLAIEGNTQRLDGGAMYGNAPRKMWQQWSAPDEHHRIRLATRALYLETDDGRKLLFETGAGAFFEPTLQERFGIEPPHHILIENLAKEGIHHEDIDEVILSHLHFDHAGGLVTAFDGSPHRLLFPKARFFVGEKQWQRARNPHSRDRVSYIPFILDLLEDSGRLLLVKENQQTDLAPLVTFSFSDGHTPGLMMSIIALPGGPIVFVSDLIPASPWVRGAITMGYDRYPELLIDEKHNLLKALEALGGTLFFTHDPDMIAGRVLRDAQGKVTVKNTPLEDLLRASNES